MIILSFTGFDMVGGENLALNKPATKGRGKGFC
jgi:hypothetical protein